MDQLTKSFLTKIANQEFQGNLLPPGQSALKDPEGLGSQLGRHLQTFPGFVPGTDEFNKYISEKNFTPEYGQGLYNMQQRFLGMAQDPRAVRNMALGRMPDFTPITRGIGYGQFLPNTFGQSVKNVGISALDLAGRYAGLGPQIDATRAALEAQTKSRIQAGLMGSLDRNSPFARNMLARMGTTHIGNKIDDWTSGMGTFGRGLRGAGHFLTGVLSKAPGYETIMNKGIDWFGPDLSKVFPKTASVSPYAHYSRIRTSCGTEVLSPWNRR